jgi:hypothetical protein
MRLQHGHHAAHRVADQHDRAADDLTDESVEQSLVLVDGGVALGAGGHAETVQVDRDRSPVRAERGSHERPVEV